MFISSKFGSVRIPQIRNQIDAEYHNMQISRRFKRKDKKLILLLKNHFMLLSDGVIWDMRGGKRQNFLAKKNKY